MQILIVLVGCGKSAGDIDSRACEGSHAQIALSYRQTEMARAFHRIREEEVPGGSFVHDKSGRKYELLQRNESY